MRPGQPSDLEGVVTEFMMTAYLCRQTLPDAFADGSGPAPSGRACL
jgi:hypothetical protein